MAVETLGGPHAPEWSWKPLPDWTSGAKIGLIRDDGESITYRCQELTGGLKFNASSSCCERATTFETVGLEHAAAYAFRVRAVNAAGVGEPSPAIWVPTAPAAAAILPLSRIVYVIRVSPHEVYRV